MTSKAKKRVEKYKKIKTILVSQPKPERSPYYTLEQKYGLTIDWQPFIQVEGLTEKEFRKQRVRGDDYTAIILTSKNAVDNFFRLNEDMRVKMSQQTKYFCLTEAIANYLQKFIIYRKRKVFVGHRDVSDLESYFTKHNKEKFLLPCSNLGSKRIIEYLKEKELDYQEAMMYRTVSTDLSHLSDIKYDVLIFFSPLGITSLFENFPSFSQDETRIAVYGNATTKAAEDHGLHINIKAPRPDIPSTATALEYYLKKSN